MGRPYLPKSDLRDTAGRIRIDFKPLGNWADTLRKLNRLGPDVRDASTKAQLKVAKEIVRRVKAHIRNQDLGWPPLSAEYSAVKLAFGLNPKTLYAYGNYYRAIEAWKAGNNSVVNAGVKKGKYTKTLSGKRSRWDIATIAAIHEFSSGKRIPRRPLWNPTIKELGGANGIKKMYINSLLYHLRMKGIPIKTFKNLF